MPNTEAPSTYVPYSDSVEKIQPDEEKTNAEINAVLDHISTMMLERFHHSFRSVHAKSHGFLRGQLEVYDSLPEPLRQGLFASPASYPVVMRFSTNPGDILPDSISTPRGLAVKVVGVSGEMLQGHAGEVTQDFVFANGKAFSVPDAASFLKQQHLIEKHADDSVPFKQVVSTAARDTNAVLKIVGHESKALAGLGYPETHILGETFGSLAPLRYGDYVAKIVIAPFSDNLKALTDKHIDVKEYSALRNVVHEFFQTETAIWEVRVQLCTDLEKMPVEDASVEWPEDLSPYQPIARIVVEPQETYSPERRVYVNDSLSFSPWHALTAHRPLGGIMRARKTAYEASRRFREKNNVRAIAEPKSIEELPE